ncbi:MAG TPA: HPr kinase/phosphatase C-terminal domain-containing protein [Caulobacteraceae bacterium]|nr:HPr kinase/phosphatase C-terminal domain-containing protein [Caulobacteraceae bacterium]
MSILHATAVARWSRGAWSAALLRGPSGAGKSDLALSAMAAGWRLVADDRVMVWASGGRLWGRAPARLAGLVEARGLGVLPAPSLDWAEIALVVDLSASTEALERIPPADWVAVAGVRLRRIDFYPRESSALAKLEFALQAAPLGDDEEPAYQARSHGRGRQRPPLAGASHEE